MKKHTNKYFTVTDPVCGMEVSYKTANDSFYYQGKTYDFCTKACRQMFEIDPERYIWPH
jgi:YHS domain-containing protein